MDCDAAYVCLERVLVHFGTSHVVLMMLGRVHPSQSRSYYLALDIYIYIRTYPDSQIQIEDREIETYLYEELLA